MPTGMPSDPQSQPTPPVAGNVTFGLIVQDLLGVLESMKEVQAPSGEYLSGLWLVKEVVDNWFNTEIRIAISHVVPEQPTEG